MALSGEGAADSWYVGDGVSEELELLGVDAASAIAARAASRS